MIVGRWYVQLAAIWCLLFAAMHLYNIQNVFIASVHSFFIFFFNQVSIN